MNSLLDQLLARASGSRFYLMLLNLALLRIAIPFNAPHGFSVSKISPTEVKITLPKRRRNLNHIGSIHACAMATAAEFASGLLLIHRLGISSYRIILQSLSLEYLYQGRQNAQAHCKIDEQWLEEELIKPLSSQEKIEVETLVEVIDQDDNLLCKARVRWQLKQWSSVKLKKKQNSG